MRGKCDLLLEFDPLLLLVPVKSAGTIRKFAVVLLLQEFLNVSTELLVTKLPRKPQFTHVRVKHQSLPAHRQQLSCAGYTFGD